MAKKWPLLNRCIYIFIISKNFHGYLVTIDDRSIFCWVHGTCRCYLTHSCRETKMPRAEPFSGAQLFTLLNTDLYRKS